MQRSRPCGRTRTLLFLVLAAAAMLPAEARAGTADPLYVPGRLVVRYRSGASALKSLASESPAGRLKGRSRLLFPANLQNDVADAFRSRFSRTVQVSLSPDEEVLAAAERWSRDPEVEYAGPVHLIPLLGASNGPPASGSAIPTDPDLALQWQHDAIGSRQAWEVTSGDSTMVIGIVDTGVDYRHPDLIHNLWSNRAEALGEAGVDDDGNGYVDDVSGYDFTDVPEVDGAGDFTDRDPDPSDDVGHGTWVTGVACATGNNGIGGAGVAFGARFMPLRAGFRPRVGFSLGFLAEDDAAAAVVYAVDNGARVLNLSFGDQVRAPILEDAVRYAVDRGVLVVAASGNSGDSEPFYPAGLSGVLAVGASERDGQRASYSTWGAAVRLLAPGTAVYTTDLGSGYTSKSGTSLASPIAAGSAALLWSLHPDWPAGQVLSTLEQSANAGSTASGSEGARFLNLGAAVYAQPAATILIEGLDAGDVFDGEVPIRGSVQGPFVRGWRVLARREPSEPWKTLAYDPREPALNELMTTWDVSQEAEGPAEVRVEALGIDQVVHHNDYSIAIDHSPPVIMQWTALPILAGSAVGIRVHALLDEEVTGTLTAWGSSGRFESKAVTSARRPVLGLDGPLAAPGELLTLRASFANAAGLKTSTQFTIRLPDAPQLSSLRRLPAPSVRSWLPLLVDLDQDGRPDAVAETTPASGSTYGTVVAYSAEEEGCDCPDGPLRPVWDSKEQFIPQDAADFDGDGYPDLLGLGLQEIRVYSRSSASGFPDELRWSSGEAWPARFIPAPGGTGFDIVASRDAEIRIYRRSGEDLALRQAIPNPTGGLNSISPAIVAVRAGPGLPVTLATVDADDDLIVFDRGSDGLFQSRWSIGLEGDYVNDLVAADLDGDGVDEIIVVEAIGSVSSPAGGLRDGYYQLHAFRRQAGAAGYQEMNDVNLGAAGQFPGNAVALSAAPDPLGGPDRIWWGINGRLYLVGWNDLRQGVEFLGAWDNVFTGHPASGNLARAGAGSRPATLFPGDSPERPGTLLVDSPSSPLVPVNLDLRLSGAAPHGTGIAAIFRWNNQAPPFTLSRTSGGATPDFVVSDLTATTFQDTTLSTGNDYVYTVSSLGGGPVSSLAVRAVLGNPVVRTVAGLRQADIEWAFPIRSTEEARIEVTGVTVTSATLDRGGTRLLLRFAEPLEPEVLHVFRVTGYRTDPAFSLSPPDSDGVLALPLPVPSLALSAVRVVDDTHLRLEFEPIVPAEPEPSDFMFEPTLHVIGVSGDGPNALELELDPATPLRAGSYHVRLGPGLSGPGAVVRSGSGDALAFSVTPVVYPNPARGDRPVRFDWLMEGARVTVMDLQGRPVWSGVAGNAGALVWDVRENSGKLLAPGIYLFRIEGLEQTFGKLAIIR
jgi:subtilisin family serine protease